MDLNKTILDVDLSLEINAPIERVFEKMIHRFTNEHTMPDGSPLPLKLEAYPGGRWFRDLGNDTGHFWGHVQVIKPPTLIEFNGPMFMSYPASSHLALRLSKTDSGTKVALRHRAIGMIEEHHREGVNSGWQHSLDLLKNSCE